VRRFLEAAASTEGTGSRAQLDRYPVIGKTGTARNVVRGAYTNSYTSSFAGIFHADDPQLVAVIRIVNPGAGEYYGGLVAAPLMKTMLQNALSARKSALDRGRLAERPAPALALAPAPDGEATARPMAPVVVSLPLRESPAGDPADVEVPEVRGMTLRRAAHLLHLRGLRVKVDGVGTVATMVPEAGARVPESSVVRLGARGDGPSRD
jgi:hypothetical protein